MSSLVERLRRSKSGFVMLEGPKQDYVNPDGPEAANEIERLEMENGALRHYAECCDEEIKAWREGRGAEYLAAMKTLEEEMEALSIHEGKPDA